MSIETESVPEKESGKRKKEKFLLALLACVIACSAYYHFMVNIAHVDVEMNVTQRSTFAIYWATEKRGYSRKRVIATVVEPGRDTYSFYLTDISKVSRLRIDTHDYAGEVTLKRMVINQEGYEPIVFEDSTSFETLVPLQQIDNIKIDENGLSVQSIGNDPYFEVFISPHCFGVDKLWLFTRMVVIFILTFIVVYVCSPLVKKFDFVPILLFGIWLLVLTMAGISRENVHPDEYVHIAATSYYADNWLPPAADDPSVRNTYSVYGFSRLNSCEIYYLLSGKTYKLLQFFELPATFAYRFFNVALFGVIFLFSTRNVYARIAALPYLVSSQIWYVFSYCGSDAFALFLTYFATYQLINPNSILHRYLKGGGGLLRLIALVVLPISFGMLFTLKMNYYPFVGFLYLVLGWRIFFTDEYYWEKKKSLQRLILITLLGFTFLGVRVGADYVMNGDDKNGKIAALQEEYANYEHKPSTPQEEKGSTLYMKDRGVSFTDLVSKYHWDIRTFQSSFGVFGYLNIISSHHYYLIVKWFGAALVMFILISSFIRGGILGAGASVVACGVSFLLVLASLHHSWVADFQPQGRYLFPVIPMFGICLGHNIKAIEKRVLVLLVGIMCMLGLYSFIFQGLLKIPKIPF